MKTTFIRSLCLFAVSPLFAGSLSSSFSGDNSSFGGISLSGPSGPVYRVSAPEKNDGPFEVSETVVADALRVNFSITKKRPDQLSALEWSDVIMASVKVKLERAGMNSVETFCDLSPTLVKSGSKSSGLFGGDASGEVFGSVNFSVTIPLKDKSAASSFVELRKTLDSALDKEEKDGVVFASPVFVVTNPESHRQALLGKIAASAVATRKALSSGIGEGESSRYHLDYEVPGLESSVGQRDAGYGKVTLYLPYSMRWRTVADPVR